jgi:hypothetical protein
MPAHWRVICAIGGCDGRIVWQIGQPSRWLDEQAHLIRGSIQTGWCDTCAAYYEQRSSRSNVTLWLEVGGHWERVPLREICVP